MLSIFTTRAVRLCKWHEYNFIPLNLVPESNIYPEYMYIFSSMYVYVVGKNDGNPKKMTSSFSSSLFPKTHIKPTKTNMPRLIPSTRLSAVTQIESCVFQQGIWQVREGICLLQGLKSPDGSSVGCSDQISVRVRHFATVKEQLSKEIIMSLWIQ